MLRSEGIGQWVGGRRHHPPLGPSSKHCSSTKWRLPSGDTRRWFNRLDLSGSKAANTPQIFQGPLISGEPTPCKKTGRLAAQSRSDSAAIAFPDTAYEVGPLKGVVCQRGVLIKGGGVG